MDNCYSNERIPREVTHKQSERLTTKHIQTLQFVQDLGNENKELKKRIEQLEEQTRQCGDLHTVALESKEKIKALQEQYLKRADEMNAMMAEKHRVEIMKVIEEKLDQEQQLTEEIREHKATIEGLQKANMELEGRLTGLSNDEGSIEDLNNKIDGYKIKVQNLQLEIDSLKNENDKLQDEQTNQFSEFQRLQYLKSQNETLGHELEETKQIKLEMKFRIEKLEREVLDLKGENKQIELVDELKTKLAKFYHEQKLDAEVLTGQEKMIKNVRLELELLKKALRKSEYAREELTAEYNSALEEILALRKQLGLHQPKKDFKEFVVLKRELNALKDENSDLKQLARSAVHMSSSLPVLKYEPRLEASKSSANVDKDITVNRTRKKSKSKSPIQS